MARLSRLAREAGRALLLALTFAIPAMARDLALSPFAATSPWNRPVQPGALFSGPDDPVTADLLAGPHALIHAGHWGMAIFIARAADPAGRVDDTENQRSFTISIPPEARPDPEEDGHLFIVAPDHRSVLEMYRARARPDGGFTARRAFLIDLAGPGMFLHDGRYPGVRAMDASGLGGVLRAWEIQGGAPIRHALTFLLPARRLRHGPVWPSAREDFWGFRDYHGHVPIGTLIAIPPGIDVATLGLSPPGLALARALQTYGAYCDDSVGTDGLVLTAENAAEAEPALAAMRTDFPVIRRYLRAVLNNHP